MPNTYRIWDATTVAADSNVDTSDSVDVNAVALADLEWSRVRALVEAATKVLKRKGIK